MDIPRKKIKGRPVLQSGRRSRKIDARFTEEEFQMIVDLEVQLGIRRTDLIRIRLLHNSKNLVVNAKDLIAHLDLIGAELGRTGNNINQLAKYANTLKKQGLLSPEIADRYLTLLERYNETQQSLQISIRKIIRKMGS